MSRLILHLSDLHFGRIQAGLPEALAAAAERLAPDIVVVSGDLTQRARPAEFQQARAFLARLPDPKIVVPGNHDVPLHNLYDRFFERLKLFQSYITDDLDPTYIDSEVAIFGVNTARSLTWKNGRINTRQIEDLRERMCPLPVNVTRIVVTHHPVDLPEGYHHRNLVGSARLAFEQWAHCGADLLLSGHLHIADSILTLDRYAGRRQAIVIHAGTATSTRGRGTPNSFNAIRIEGRGSVTVTKWIWDDDAMAFRKGADARFERNAAGWKRSEAAPEESVGSGAVPQVDA